MAAPGEPVVMGRVLGAYGIHGWLRVQPYTESPQGLTGYPKWWLRQGQEGWREVAVAEARAHGSLLVARLEGDLSREGAARLRGVEIGVPRTAFPVLGEGTIYETDLIGLRVVNRSGEELGRVQGLVSNGAHPVVRVQGQEGAERLLPYVPTVVERVDLEAGALHVDWGADW